MNKIKEYLFIYKSNVLEFNILINEHLKNGWTVYGNPIMVYDHPYEDNNFGQALVKYV